MPAHTEADDLILAARTTCPVLVTGAPDGGLEIAWSIVTRGPGGGRVRVCEPDDSGKLLLTEPCDAVAPGVVLLRDVERLSQESQAWLFGWLEQASNREVHPRIIASSSTSLFDHVKRRAFDERLFYRLNAIHLVAGEPVDATRELGDAVEQTSPPQALLIGPQPPS